MVVELATMWRGYPAGTRLDSLFDGVAEILIQRGIAREIDTGNRDESDSGTDHAERSKKAPRNKRK